MSQVYNGAVISDIEWPRFIEVPIAPDKQVIGLLRMISQNFIRWRLASFTVAKVSKRNRSCLTG